jgi:hypothetical protein
VKRAVLYMRVSTLDQHPETQLLDLRQMAAQRGYEIVEEYTDRISGAKARRPGLDQMMAEARRGHFDVVLVWASDRIARSVKHFLEVLDELNRLNIEFGVKGGVKPGHWGGVNVWSAAVPQAKSECGRLVCANVFGLCWRDSSGP